MGLRLDLLLLVFTGVLFSFEFGNSASSPSSSFSMTFDVNDLNDLSGDGHGKLADLKIPISVASKSSNNKTNCFGTPREIIERNGYIMEDVEVVTDDDYILTMWRICKNASGKSSNSSSNSNSCARSHDNQSKKYPVLLQHGLASSGEDWLFLNRDVVLPFLLVENGFDVFIGNSRGSKYSMGHKSYLAQNPLSPYWAFSVHEMGVYDLPASINKIRNLTGADRINYVGYSMGTTMFFILKSENVAFLNAYTYKFVALAPAMFIGNFATQIGPLKELITSNYTGPLLGKVLELLFIGDGPFGMPADQLAQVLRRNVAANLVKPLQYVETLLANLGPQKLLDYLVGGRPLIKNSRAFECALSHSFPSGASRRTLRHYIQFFTTKEFRQYNYMNPALNLLNYQRISPPHYDRAKKVNTSIFVVEGEKDSLTVPQDVQLAFTSTNFKHCGCVAKCAFPCADHLDFVYGPNGPVKEFVHNVAVNWLGGCANRTCPGNKYLNNTDGYCESIVE